MKKRKRNQSGASTFYIPPNNRNYGIAGRGVRKRDYIVRRKLLNALLYKKKKPKRKSQVGGIPFPDPLPRNKYYNRYHNIYISPR